MNESKKSVPTVPAEKPNKKQTTKEMFESMTKFFFKNLCNCKK